MEALAGLESLSVRRVGACEHFTDGARQMPKGYPPTLQRFCTTPQTLLRRQSQQRVRAFCLLQF